MSNQFQYIASLCEKIKASGKLPSVALVKKASNRPLPLKDIIEVLKRWQSDPEQFSKAPLSEPIADKPDDLLSHIKNLEQRIVALENQVQSLSEALRKKE